MWWHKWVKVMCVCVYINMSYCVSLDEWLFTRLICIHVTNSCIIHHTSLPEVGVFVWERGCVCVWVFNVILFSECTSLHYSPFPQILPPRSYRQTQQLGTHKLTIPCTVYTPTKPQKDTQIHAHSAHTHIHTHPETRHQLS